jgi:hypothetical protein
MTVLGLKGKKILLVAYYPVPELVTAEERFEGVLGLLEVVVRVAYVESFGVFCWWKSLGVRVWGRGLGVDLTVVY